MKRTTLFAIVAFGIAAMLMVATPSMAVHKNFDNKLACGSCHTMHNSQGGGVDSLDGATDGTIVLLRGDFGGREDIHNLCLNCHASNGAQNTETFGGDAHAAPKVFINGADGKGNGFTGANFDLIGAGGDFSKELDSSWVVTTAVAQGYGHSLGETAVTPPGNVDGAITGFSCTSCHDPHGAYNGPTTTVNWYRNLKKTPAQQSETVTLNTGIRSYVGMHTGTNSNFIPDVATEAITTIWPFIQNDAVADGTANCNEGNGINTTAVNGDINCYEVTATSATDGISNWCAACHDKWHENDAAGATNAGGGTTDWRRHPVDEALTNGENGYGKSDNGTGTSIIDASRYNVAADIAKLPVAKTSAASDQGAVIADTSNIAQTNTAKVFCLSCHFAHAGPYYDALRWDYLSSVGAGSQESNSLDSNTGCQLCHNR